MLKTKLALPLVFLASSLLHAADNSDDYLERRCQRVVERLASLGVYQYKALCRSKLTSAGYKVDVAAGKIHYGRRMEAEHYLYGAMEDLHFAVRMDCNMKFEIMDQKRELYRIKQEL